MDQSTFMGIIAVFTVIAALAMVFQAFFLFGTYKATKAVHDRVTALTPKIETLLPKLEAVLPKVESLLESSRLTVEESRATIVEIRAKSNLLLDGGQRQIRAFENLIGDASDRTRRQMDHAEVLVADTLQRAEETVALVHRGIMKPIRGVTGLAAGFSTALHVLMRGGRPNPDQVTLDEEMFI